MASEDVIELGSSDEETRPTKKIKANAMVHIPGVTIKPTMASAVPGGTKGPRIVKVHNAALLGNKTIGKSNGKTIPPVNVTKKSVTIRKDLQKGALPARKDLQKGSPVIMNNTLNVNPVSLMKKLNNSQIKINKLPSNMSVLKSPIPVMKGPINIPSSITVKKTNKNSILKRPAASIVSGVKKKVKINPVKAVREVLTIDSDEEETTKSQSAKPAPGPQWYLRPEDQEDLKTQEEKNNTEPDTSKFIEITIEDSPVKPKPAKDNCPVKPKPVKDKRTSEVGTELAITIDDSPVKPKETSSDNNREAGETPHSKKKLVYPVETVEIEIEPMEIDTHIGDVQEPEKDPFSTVEQTDTNSEHMDGTDRDSEMIENKTKNNKNKDEEDKNEVTIDQQIIEVVESPAKKKNVKQIDEPKKAPSKVIDLDLEDDSPPTSSEFHPVYQEFINLCLKIENSVDMNTIVEKKIKSYYRQVPKEYTESEEFIDMVSGKLLSMKAGPEKIYLYIKDIVDELNMQRKLAKQQALNEMKKKTAEEEKFLYGEETEFDSKRQRQIRKLEKTLKKLHRAIQKLEEQEVDFDDEEDSVYLLTERYKERMVRVHAKLCQLTNTKMPSEPRVQIDARPGQPAGPAKRLEKWVNKKVPIGTPLPFPDFHDVLRCVREANEEDKLGWNEADVMEEARDLFTRCGKKLQRRRQENEWRLAASRISADIDPAEENETLKKKLEENRQLATKKETDVFNKFADRQSMLKLEAEFVGDKEAEESPVESEEEEAVDESCVMKNKERRKERLRRLIQEKPKSSDKSSSPLKEPNLNKMNDEFDTDVKDNAEVENDTINAEKDTEKSEIQEANKDDNKAESKEVESVHSISDSSDNVGSDVDELHLLQKLHSENEVDSSTSESSESMIDISDTIQSDDDNNDKGKSDDVISIENSSYSDSERSNDAKNDKMESNKAEGSSASNKTMDTQADSVEKDPNAEQVHLTISDEDRNSKEDNESQGSDVTCMNTQDDAISIGDTEIQGIKNPETSIRCVIESNSKQNSPGPVTDDNPDKDLTLNNIENPTINEVTETELKQQNLSQESDNDKNIDTLTTTEVSETKVDEKVLSKESSKDETNENIDKPTVTEVTKDKNDEQILRKKSEVDESGRQGNNESTLSLNDDGTASDNVGPQDADLTNTASSLNDNSEAKANEHSSFTEKDELLEKNIPENSTESVSSKVGDMGEETLALSNDIESTISDNVPALKDTDVDMSEDKNKIDSLEQMLEEFRSDLEADKC